MITYLAQCFQLKNGIDCYLTKQVRYLSGILIFTVKPETRHVCFELHLMCVLQLFLIESKFRKPLVVAESCIWFVLKTANTE